MARDMICREIMAVTGCDYTTAMRERDLRWANRRLDGYLSEMRSLPPRGDADPQRCVACFEPATGAKHKCRGKT